MICNSFQNFIIAVTSDYFTTYILSLISHSLILLTRAEPISVNRVELKSYSKTMKKI